MSSINHIESHLVNQPITNPNHNPPSLTFIENIDRLLNLIKSNYSGIQYTGIRGISDLSNCPNFKYLVKVFSKYRSMVPIFKLVKSKDEKVRSETMSLLWNLSAEESLKVKFFEEGILTYIDELLELNDDPTLMPTSAIIQNLSEYRFERGTTNQNQLKITKIKSIIPTIIERSKSTDRRVKFLSCLTICNLSMNQENRAIFKQRNLFQIVSEFNTEFLSEINFPSSFNWVTLQPHIALLPSPDEDVQLFVLYCLLSFSKSEKYSKRLWKVIGNNDGILYLQRLKESNHPIIKDLANQIVQTLFSDSNSHSGFMEDIQLKNDAQLKNEISILYNNSLMFPDVLVQCEETNQSLYVHKSICQSRCPRLALLFDRGEGTQNIDSLMSPSDQNIIKGFLELNINSFSFISNGDSTPPLLKISIKKELYLFLEQVFKWIYGLKLDLPSEKFNKRMLKIAHYLNIEEIKNLCEYNLWFHIDIHNCARLLNLSITCNAEQLKRVTMEFILRNFEKIYFGFPEEVLGKNYQDSVKIDKLWFGKWNDICKQYVINSYQEICKIHHLEIQEINKEAIHYSNDFFRI